MRSVDLASLQGLEALRSTGVKCFSDGTTSVEFFPVESNAGEQKAPVIEPEPSCRCGHEHAKHIDGLCLEGCDVEKCAPPEVG